MIEPLNVSNLLITRVILNGSPMNGWADTEDSLTLPQQEVMIRKQGPDGKMAAGFTGKIGGDVVIKLLPNSNNVPIMDQILSEYKTGITTELNMTIQYSNNSFKYCRKGYLMSAPSGFTQGNGVAKDMEYTIFFESIM